MPPDRLAVLVDVDNVAAGHIAFAVKTAGHYGHVVLKRAFGRLDSVVGKADALSQHGFTAEVVFPPRGNGKNAADLMLAQCATRLAERRAVETVVLVSSDGDFAPMATGLSEAGIRTLCFGRQDTPAMLRGACTHFIPFAESQPDARAVAPPQGTLPENAGATLTKIINDEMEGGKVHLSTIAKRLIAEFGKNYKARFGGKRVSQLVAGLEGFSMRGAGANKEWVIRRPAAEVVSLPARPAASG